MVTGVNSCIISLLLGFSFISLTLTPRSLIAVMETGAGGGGKGQQGGKTGIGIPQKPPEEPNLRPEWRRPTRTEQDVVLQPEWRRPRPSAPLSEPSNRVVEEELLFQPEWRRSKPSASAIANANASVWEPERRRSRPTATAFPWNQNYGVRKGMASSSGGGGGVERRGDPNDLWRRPAPPATGICIHCSKKCSLLLGTYFLFIMFRGLRLGIGTVETTIIRFLLCPV